MRERFWGKVDKSGECWIWKSATWGSGYGFFWVGGKKRSEYAHRVSWRLANDVAEIPAGAVVMHSCDNKLCVNPAHLRLGTAAENMADREAKGRGAKGERNGGGGKLTEQAVRTIRSLKGVQRRKEVAAMYAVHEGTIKDVWSRRIWRCVEG